MHYFLFCVTGRMFEPSHVKVLEQLWIATGYPDARIWCNRVAGYMGSARVDPGFSMSAAIAASNGVSYGFRACRLAYQVQSSIPQDEAERIRWADAQLSEQRILPGYGRPIHRHDERIAFALKSLAGAGLRAGPALKRAFWLHQHLQRAKGIEINISALWAAVCIDFGIVAREYDSFMVLMFAPGYAAVHADQRSRSAFSFLSGHQTQVDNPDLGA